VLPKWIGGTLERGIHAASTFEVQNAWEFPGLQQLDHSSDLKVAPLPLRATRPELPPTVRVPSCVRERGAQRGRRTALRKKKKACDQLRLKYVKKC
jgi:hypothetical protein